MKYYAFGLILLTILSVNDTSIDWERTAAWVQLVSPFGRVYNSELVFFQPKYNSSSITPGGIQTDLRFSLGKNEQFAEGSEDYWSVLLPGRDPQRLITGTIDYGATFRSVTFDDFLDLKPRAYTYTKTIAFKKNSCDFGAPGNPDDIETESRSTNPVYFFPISGQYQLAEFTGKDGDQFELTDAELAANTLTIHHVSNEMDFALDAPLDTASHRWLYEYFDEYGYDRTNHLEVQQSNITASVDSFGVTSRFKMSGLEIDNNTFQEANLRLLITLEQGENDQQLLAMAIEDTPFSFVFERIGDASSSSSMKKRVTRR